ncbi:MAG: four helix bundle protein [Chitinophagaceae bacterium]|nr:four helix bundle protein [Chitinophagaceae bacterium]
MASKITSFEDLIIWQKAQDLAARIHRIADANEYIRRDHTLRNQLKSAALSISDNIAEGFEYNNNPDFYRFLRIAKGSCGEIRNKILFIMKLNYIDNETAMRLVEDSKLLGEQIGGLIKKVKAKLAERKVRSNVTRNTSPETRNTPSDQILLSK